MIRHKLNELRKKIITGVNEFDLLSDKKEEDNKPNKVRQIFISSKNDINILAQSPLELVLFPAESKFSLILKELNKFEFDEPLNKKEQLDTKLFNAQVYDIDSFLKDKLKNENEKGDTFKQILDNLQKINNKNNLREYFDRWRKAVHPEKQDSLNHLVNKLNDILTKANKESNDQLKKDALDNLKKIMIAKRVEKLDDVINQKPKRDFLDKLKKNKNIVDAEDN